jgi:hypothetical protein
MALINRKKHLTKKTLAPQLTPAEQFWEEVNQLSQTKIHQLLISNLPLPNLKLITEPWRFTDKQQALSGLFLDKDVDYRTLLGDIENQYAEEDLPDKEYLAEEIALSYVHMVIKALIADLSEYSAFDPSFFENLTD